MNKKECEKCRFFNLLSSSGEASAWQECFLERHLAACPMCREESYELNKLPALPDMPVSGETLAGIKARSFEVLSGKNRGFQRRLLVKPAFAAAAAAAAVFFVFFFRPAGIVDELPSAEYDYQILDQRLISAENSMQAISLDFFSEFNGF